MTTAEANARMQDQNRCPQCGVLVEGALAGLCPACLLQQGAAAETATGPVMGGFEPPSLTELAAHFPQLEIVELIGKGGMGAVYKARQKELDRVVALKILPPAMGDTPGFAERFSREAKALAKLNHPGIVTIHEFGRADGLFYFLMEFVDGVNLRQLLASGRVSPREALAIVPEICDALQFAHDHGIVHRDIKPANILLDRRGRVKVADFGLAKLVAAAADAAAQNDATAAASALTQAGRVMGTPSYMAPEQTARPDEVDHRADIYSLGVVLYELLTGELPAAQLQPPSRKVRVDVRLDEIVLRALQERPERRYQTAVEFNTQLTAVADEPEPAHSSGRSRKTPVTGSRRSGRIAAVVALLLLLGCVAVAFLPPREYYAKVTMEVLPDGYSAFSGRNLMINPSFFASQTQALRKREILATVVKNLGLEKAYSLSVPEAAARLDRSLNIRHIGDGGLIEVGVYDRDPQRAATIANTIAVVFKQRHYADFQSGAVRGLAQFRREVERQRQRVEEARVEMEQISARDGIVDPAPNDVNADVTSPDGTVDHQAYVKTKARYLSSARILQAAEAKLESETNSFQPVMIREKAEPPDEPSPFRLRRFW